MSETRSAQKFGDESTRSGPLSGLRVLDLTRMLAGPFCTMLLADMGADVVKVEPPFGDLTREMGPFRPNDSERLFGGYFQSVNRNKRSVVLDFEKDDDRHVVRDLVLGADILVENFRPGIMERFGLGYEELARLNPALIYGAIRGFGDPRTGESPYARWPAYDIVVQAMGGLMGITGEPGRPTKAGPGVGDIFPAVLCTVGILAAVHERSRSGKGQFVDVGMYDGVLALCERIVHQYSYEGIVGKPQGNTHPILSPFDIFECADGAVSIAAPSDNHWVALAHIMQRPDLAESYLLHSTRQKDKRHLREVIGDWTRTKTKRELLELLGGKVPVGPVNSVVDIMADPHVRAREMIVELPHPGLEEPTQVVGLPIKLSRTPGKSFHRAPLLGELSLESLRREWGAQRSDPSEGVNSIGRKQRNEPV